MSELNTHVVDNAQEPSFWSKV